MSDRKLGSCQIEVRIPKEGSQTRRYGNYVDGEEAVKHLNRLGWKFNEKWKHWEATDLSSRGMVAELQYFECEPRNLLPRNFEKQEA